MEIKIKDIKILRNIRTEIGDVSILMMSIRENGLLEPIGICQIKGEYILVYGHRRFSALKKLGRKSLVLGEDFIIKDDINTMEDILIYNTIENFHRVDNTPLEFAKVSSDLKEFGLTTPEIAVSLTCSKNKILTALNLLDKVPKSQVKNISYGGSGRNTKKGQLPANVASAIADRTVRYNLNEKDTEQLYNVAREKELSTSNVKLVSLGLEDGLKFNNAIKLVDSFQAKQIEFLINKKELSKIKIPFRKYIINCLKGKEKFNQKLLY